MKIAITTSSFARYSDEPLKLLDEAGVEYVLNDKGRALTEEEAIEILEGCDGVAAGTEPLTRKVMDAVPTLKVISRCGTGMDSVDRACAAEKGIEVRDAPTARAGRGRAGSGAYPHAHAPRAPSGP